VDFSEIFGGVGHGPKINRLDFDGDPDPEFLDSDRSWDAGIFPRILYLLLRFLWTAKNRK